MLGRAGRLLKSSVGALLAPADDPRPGFALAYQRHSDLLKKVRLARSELRSAREQIDRRRSELLEQIPVLDETARSALLGGCDSAARSALKRRVTAAANAESLAEQIGDLMNEEQKLQLIEQRLATQIDSFYARQQVLAARFNAAEAQLRINEALAGLSGELADLGLALEQAEDSAMWMHARASALDEMMAVGLTGDQLEDGSGAPAGLDAEVEVRLARLASDLRRPVP